MEKMKNIKTKLQALYEQIQIEGEAAIQEAASAFFKAVPEAYCITWTQYTPYFMDGEECIFGVGEVILRIHPNHREELLGINDPVDDLDEEDDLDTQFELLEQNLDDSDSDNLINTPRSKEIKQAFDNFCSIITSNDEILKIIFGDHVQVIVTEDEISQTEYEHE